MSLTHKYADISLQSEILNLLDASMDSMLEGTADFPREEAKTVKRLAKSGLKSESFAREALDLAKIYEELMPRALDLERFERTIANRDAIRARLRKAEMLVERLKVLSVLLGVDSYSDALDVYHSLKRHGRDQAIQSAVKELGRIFKRSKKEAVEEPAQESAQPAEATPPENGADGTDATDGTDAARHTMMRSRPPEAYPSHPSHGSAAAASQAGSPPHCAPSLASPAKFS